jgi:hypothetical protein
MSTKLTSTTLSAAVAGGTNAPNSVILASVTGVAAPTAGGGIQTMLLIDGELMTVQSVNTVSLVATVQRGQGGTKVAPHGNGATVWLADPTFFAQYNYGGVGKLSGRYRFFTADALQASLTALGTSTADTAGGIFLADVNVDRLLVSTGAAVLNGATVGTDLNVVLLYDASGTLIANSNAVGAVTAGASAFQQRAWVNPVILVPGQYFLGYQTNGTTDNFQTIKTATWVNVLAGTLTGTFGTFPNPITLPATFTADKGPFGYIY